MCLRLKNVMDIPCCPEDPVIMMMYPVVMTIRFLSLFKRILTWHTIGNGSAKRPVVQDTAHSPEQSVKCTGDSVRTSTVFSTTGRLLAQPSSKPTLPPDGSLSSPTSPDCWLSCITLPRQVASSVLFQGLWLTAWGTRSKHDPSGALISYN